MKKKKSFTIYRYKAEINKPLALENLEYLTYVSGSYSRYGTCDVKEISIKIYLNGDIKYIDKTNIGIEKTITYKVNDKLVNKLFSDLIDFLNNDISLIKVGDVLDAYSEVTLHFNDMNIKAYSYIFTEGVLLDDIINNFIDNNLIDKNLVKKVDKIIPIIEKGYQIIDKLETYVKKGDKIYIFNDRYLCIDLGYDVYRLHKLDPYSWYDTYGFKEAMIKNQRILKR